MSKTLTPTERKVLHALELQADIPLATLAKVVGVQSHTLHYTVKRLEQRGVISKRTFINSYPLGYADYALYFSLVPDKQSTLYALLEYLKASEVISWLAYFGGEYQYGMAISATSAHEVQKFLEVVSEKFPGIFFHKSLSIRTSLTLISRKYLFDKDVPPRTIRFGHTQSATHIDVKDHLILAGLESQEDISLRELSRKLSIPLTTIQQRVVSLKSRGILQGAIYQVDPTSFGMQAFRFLIETKSVDKTLRNELYAFCLAHRHICYFIECLGSWDYELGVEVPDGDTAIATQQELYRKFSRDLIQVSILPLFGHLKIRNYPFIRPPQN